MTDSRMIIDGVWCDCRQGPSLPPRPGLFLDRDGTVIDWVHYISNPDDVRLIPAAVRLLRVANQLGIPAVVVTNQSGIGRGMFGWESFIAVQERTDALLAAEGVSVAAVLACSHSPTDGSSSDFRKPAPGMLIEASKRLGLVAQGSWMIGDNAADLEAGRNAGLGHGWLVETGYGPGEVDKALRLAGPDFTVIAGKSLDELTSLLPGEQ